jgi:hypothetical protein
LATWSSSTRRQCTMHFPFEIQDTQLFRRYQGTEVPRHWGTKALRYQGTEVPRYWGTKVLRIWTVIVR